jgi:hypothetical protein
MVTAIDSSVLLDVLLNDPGHAPASIAALHRAAAEGSLALCDAALAEIVPVLAAGDLHQFLADWKLTFLPSTRQVAILAGEMFRAYLDRGGRRGRVVPDFLIGAHAEQLADRPLARDRGYYRDYFKELDIWDPSPEHGQGRRTIDGLVRGAAGKARFLLARTSSCPVRRRTAPLAHFLATQPLPPADACRCWAGTAKKPAKPPKRAPRTTS